MENIANLLGNKIDVYVISSTNGFYHDFDTFRMLFIEYFCQNRVNSSSPFMYTHTNTMQCHLPSVSCGDTLKNMIINNTFGYGCEIKKINTINELSYIKNYHILIAPLIDPYLPKHMYNDYHQGKLIETDLFSPLILDEKIVNKFITPYFQSRLNKVNDNDKTLGIIFYLENPHIPQYVHFKNEKICEFSGRSYFYNMDDYHVYFESISQDRLILNFVEAFSQSNEIIGKIKQIKLSLIVFDICTGMHYCLQSSKPKNYKQIIPRDLFLHICKFTIMIFMNKISKIHEVKI